MTPRTWHLVTGEYPPRRGGVGDYTRLLARALAEAGRDVHVWTGAADGTRADEPSDGVTVHRLAGGFEAAGVREMDAGLDGLPGTVLVQYAPQAFGMRGMNLGLCRWALGRARRGGRVRVMFHEPFFPFGWQRPRRNLLAAVTHAMARLLLRATHPRAYVSTHAWAELLRPWAPRGTAFAWLPIPSTIPRVPDPAAVARLRGGVTGGDPARLVVGHFGTYGGMIAPLVRDTFVPLLRCEPRAVALWLGDGGPAFARETEAAHPELRGRIAAPGLLPPEDVSLHLQACDLALQPYPDGASSRRTTLMAPLAHGIATVTHLGRFSDPVFRRGDVPAAEEGDPAAMVSLAAALLADAGARAEAAARGEALYRQAFAVERTVAALLRAEEGTR